MRLRAVGVALAVLALGARGGAVRSWPAARRTGGVGRVPACQSWRSCSRRLKMRARQAKIRACKGSGNQPPQGLAAVVARRPAIWPAKELG